MASVMARSTVARPMVGASLKQSPAKTFAKAAMVKRSAVSSRATLMVAASDRPMWLTGAAAPAHLDGTLPGDYGFDPLGLGVNPDRLKWYQEAELQNGRWAMMAVAGILGTSALGVTPVWYEAGSKGYDIPALALLSIQFPVMGMLETKRLAGFQATGGPGFMNSFPFDPAGMASPAMKVKEVKNGRLAMVSIFGYWVQAFYTGVGPIENWTAHLANPFGTNVLSTLDNVAMF